MGAPIPTTKVGKSGAAPNASPPTIPTRESVEQAVAREALKVGYTNQQKNKTLAARIGRWLNRRFELASDPGLASPGAALTQPPTANAAKAKAAIRIGTLEAVTALKPAAAEAKLQSISRPAGANDPDYETLSTTEAGVLLNVTRPTILEWIKSGKIIAIKQAKRGWRIPAAQIAKGKIAPRVKDVIEAIGDAEAAWDFLVRDQVIGDRRGRPIDLMFARDADLVVSVAEGYGRDFT